MMKETNGNPLSDEIDFGYDEKKKPEKEVDGA